MLTASPSRRSLSRKNSLMEARLRKISFVAAMSVSTGSGSPARRSVSGRPRTLGRTPGAHPAQSGAIPQGPPGDQAMNAAVACSYSGRLGCLTASATTQPRLDGDGHVAAVAAERSARDCRYAY